MPENARDPEVPGKAPLVTLAAVIFWVSAVLMIVYVNTIHAPDLLRIVAMVGLGAVLVAVGRRSWASRASLGPYLVGIATLWLGVPLLLLLWPGTVFYDHPHGQLTACKSNLKDIGTAMETYATDFAGRYPPNSSLLTPNYLKTIPTCPAAGSVTYVFSMASNPDVYTVVCLGQHHRGAGIEVDGYPQYNSVQGLIERP